MNTGGIDIFPSGDIKRKVKENSCPQCDHGLGSSKLCRWCGWPDPEAAQQRTRRAIEGIATRRKDIMSDDKAEDRDPWQVTAEKRLQRNISLERTIITQAETINRMMERIDDLEKCVVSLRG